MNHLPITGRYAIVNYNGCNIKGRLSDDGTKLFNLKKKTLFLSLGADTKIIKTAKFKNQL